MTDWKTFYQQHSNQDYSTIAQPDDWQLGLAEILMRTGPKNSLEAGSGHGLTTMLLDKKVQKTLLDLEPAPLITARNLFTRQQESGDYVAGDLLEMPFDDNTFDLVFNSGVLEHFDFAGRQQALREMVRVAKPGSTLVVAIPNHFSIPYRYSYLYRKKRGQWPYPDEYRIYDFSKELQGVPRTGQQRRRTLSVVSAYNFLRRHQRILFKLRGMFQKYEGYLTVITVQKKGTV